MSVTVLMGQFFGTPKVPLAHSTVSCGSLSLRASLASLRSYSKPNPFSTSLNNPSRTSYCKSIYRISTRKRGHWIFTAAPHTYGADWVWSGEELLERRGDADAWRGECEAIAKFDEGARPTRLRKKENGETEMVESKGSLAITLALAVAFGASLIEPLAQGSFMIHFFGGSSCGKTIATLVGASVWGDPRRPASWKDTGAYLLESLPSHSGRCLVIDDLRKAQHPRSVASLILALSDNLTKGRLSRTGAQRTTHRFALAALSNGEQSMGSYLGEHDDVGHAVRCVDLPLELGESTFDRDHAKRCEKWFGCGAHGVAGPQWAKHLVELFAREGVATVETLVAKYLKQTEVITRNVATNERIGYNLALCATALEMARAAKIAPDTGISPEEMLNWAMDKVVVSRGRETSPEEKCLVELLGQLVRDPQSYPTVLQYQDQPPRVLAGIYEADDEELFLTPALVKPLCERMRVQAKSWLEWLEKMGYATSKRAADGRKARFRLGSASGLNQRWVTVSLIKARGVD